MPAALSDLKTFQHPVAAWLKTRGWSVAQAAQEWGISPGYLSLILTRWNIPGRQVALRLHEATGISLEQILMVPPRRGSRSEVPRKPRRRAA